MFYDLYIFYREKNCNLTLDFDKLNPNSDIGRTISRRMRGTRYVCEKEINVSHLSTYM
jgi:hypothetical protein